jgi:hypothetical protein
MKRSGKFIMLFLVIVVFVSNGIAFSQELWSEVKPNKSAVYVNEPVQVTISVYTSTWFTRGIDPGNIKVNGAFTVYFRPVTTTIQKNGKNYAGVQLIYNVFPYSEKDIVFPSLDITVESPPEGDSKGKKQVIKSPEKRNSVKPAPAGFNRDDWLVTSSVKVADTWQGNLKNAKVGDVLVRKITTVAEGTISELIPPVLWDSIQGVSLYKTRSIVENNKTTSGISASRTETMRYLFEREGELIIPALVFRWYDPVQEKLFKNTLEEITINVQPNPNPDMLTSVRDSLQVEEAQLFKDESESRPFTFLGLASGHITLLVLVIIALLVVSIQSIKRLRSFIISRREKYRNSEAYYFDQFKRLLKDQNMKEAISALYRWLDELKLTEPSLNYFTGKYGSDELLETVNQLHAYHDNQQGKVDLKLKLWEQARHSFLQSINNSDKLPKKGWLNPEW